MSHYYALYDKGWVIPEIFGLGPFLFSIVKILTGFFLRWPKTPENALTPAPRIRCKLTIFDLTHFVLAVENR